MATWNHLPSIRGEVRFAAESAGVFGAQRVQLPYFERPRNTPTQPTSKWTKKARSLSPGLCYPRYRCGIIVFNWPKLSGVTTVADWQWLRLAARSVINECPLQAHIGGMMIGLGAGRTYYGDKKDHSSGNLNIAVMQLPEDLPDDPGQERDWGSFLAGCARAMATDPTSPTAVSQCPGYNAAFGNGRPGNGGGPGPSGGSQSGVTAWTIGMQQKSADKCGKQSFCVNGEGCNGAIGCTCNLLLEKASNLMLGVAQDLMGTCIAIIAGS
ncbi:MAG: hypothetical protein M1812_007856 [Candelaria pacifica]|nr:MAG: hypothetical protein M1812_007856 [Candelaria pacifica]